MTKPKITGSRAHNELAARVEQLESDYKVLNNVVKDLSKTIERLQFLEKANRTSHLVLVREIDAIADLLHAGTSVELDELLKILEKDAVENP